MNETQAVEFPRAFVPDNLDLSGWEALGALFEELSVRPVASSDQLQRWVMDVSELQACIAEERSRRYIAMTCKTDDADAEARYLDFIEHIAPRCKTSLHRLNELFLTNPHRSELDPQRFGVLDRNTRARVEIFREQNVTLQTEESKLSQLYQKTCGAIAVCFDGEERTLPQMARILEETDRARRRAAWAATANRRLEERDEFDGLFDRLVALRHEMATNAGFEDHRGYAFAKSLRFDYGLQDCCDFHQAVEHCVVPLARNLAQQRRQQLQLETLRPWDLAMDSLGRPPLRPFTETEDLEAGIQRILARLDDDLATQFADMRRRRELDLESRKNKAPGGYLCTLDEVRRPFIFMNAAGVHRDVETLLHEFGHALHALACRQEPLLEYRDAPLEFAEVASMTMELFAADLLDEFYPRADAARAKRLHLEGILSLLPWIARIDAFQHWIYAHPGHDRQQRTAEWLRLEQRFGPGVCWTGYRPQQESQWQRQLHLFCHPFYYIEYGIAQVGALQIWKLFRSDPAGSLRNYRAALALGGSRPLPELFAATGARFDFSTATLQPLVEQLQEELDALPE